MAEKKSDKQSDSEDDADTNPMVASPSEFSKIPLDFIIASPLLTTIEAHKLAAMTTLDFVNSLKDAGNVEFEVVAQKKDATGATEASKKVNVPILALTKVPSLNFDSLSVNFNYNISQIVKETNEKKSKLSAKIGTTGILSKFVSASINGSIENTSNRENTVNRGGTLDVKLHVSESALPAGLEKVINAIVENIEIPEGGK